MGSGSALGSGRKEDEAAQSSDEEEENLEIRHMNLNGILVDRAQLEKE